MARTCTDCGVDISARHLNARYCVGCQRKRERTAKKKRYRDDEEYRERVKARIKEMRRKALADKRAGRTCVDCGADISDRNFACLRCEQCRRKRANMIARKRRLDPDYSKRRNSKARKAYKVKYRGDPDFRKRARARAHASRMNPERYERAKARARDRYDNDPEYRQKVDNRSREWMRSKRRDDPEWHERMKAVWRLRARDKRADAEWRNDRNAKRRAKRNDPEYKDRFLKQRRERHREKYHNDREYREKLLSTQRLRKRWDSTVTPQSVADLLKRQRRRCACCRDSIAAGYHLDHVLPQSKGGSSTLANLQLLCPSCNISKGAKLYYIPPQGGQGHLALGV